MNTLPTEVLCQIFVQAGWSELRSTLWRVCKLWYQICHEHRSFLIKQVLFEVDLGFIWYTEDEQYRKQGKWYYCDGFVAYEGYYRDDKRHGVSELMCHGSYTKLKFQNDALDGCSQIGDVMYLFHDGVCKKRATYNRTDYYTEAGIIWQSKSE